MNPYLKIGEKAPLLKLSEWSQGQPTNLDQLVGNVVLIEVFQLNCPGCFLYSLPLAVELYQKYKTKGLTVIGIATAFEDFDKNTLSNLKTMLNQGEVIGETLRVLKENNKLINSRLPYKIPFPVAMDCITKPQKQIVKQLQTSPYTPKTFNLYALQGTPSHIVIDKKGNLRARELGHFADLEWLLNILLQE